MAEMRRAEREIKDWKELSKVIEECQVVRIGSFDEEGMFIVPMNFGYEMEEVVERDGSREKQSGENETRLRLYIHSAKEGRKARAFRKNSQVALEMDCGHELIQGDYTCSYSFAFQSIMGSGTIQLVTEREEKLHGFQLLIKHTAPGSCLAFRDEILAAADVYRIDVKEFKGKRRERKK